VKGILLSGAISAIFAFFATPALIKLLAKKGYGQIIRDDGPTTHHVKRAFSLHQILSLVNARRLWFQHLARGQI
jgi:phospho-N-acetylmuramoyl-pentapeptide-transferase